MYLENKKQTTKGAPLFMLSSQNDHKNIKLLVPIFTLNIIAVHKIYIAIVVWYVLHTLLPFINQRHIFNI